MRLIPSSVTVVEVTCTLLSLRVLPWMGVFGIVEMVSFRIAAVPLSLCATAFILPTVTLQFPPFC